jgi:hypothetical protein
MVFERRTDLGRMLATLTSTRFGVVSCRCLDHDPWRSIRLGFRRFEGTAEIVDGALVRRFGSSHGLVDGLPVYDVVAQFFMARVKTLGTGPWDPSLAVGVEHVEFFWKLKEQGVLSTLLSDVVVQHYPELPPRYHKVRAKRRDDSFKVYAEERGFEDKVFEGSPFTLRDRLRYHLPSLAAFEVRRAGRVTRRTAARALEPLPLSRPLARTLVVALAILLAFVALPEAFGDRPYDPRPSRVFESLSPLGGHAQLAASRALTG